LISYLGVKTEEVGKLTLTDFRIIFMVDKLPNENKSISSQNAPFSKI
jgi:hypothetical protein